MLPTFTISEDLLPEVKTWKVGKKYHILLEVEQIAQLKGDQHIEEKDKKFEGRFRIISGKGLSGKPKDKDITSVLDKKIREFGKS